MATRRVCKYCGAVITKKGNRFCNLQCWYSFFKKPANERFWRHVDKSAGPDGCWLWTGGKDRHGYGRFAGSAAHRFSYTLAYGEIPDGLFICHHCDVPGCVNPKHLFAGTAKDNLRDASSKGRHPSQANPGCHTGTRNGRARLTPQQVRDIRRAYRPRMGGELARRYGVSQTTIMHIVNRIIWKHI